jgi:dTDP-4-dehydrorhamnose reductase
MNVLVTGATGMLGAYLVTELEQRGHDVFACGGRARTPGVDLTDSASVDALIAGVRPRTVIHAAAMSAVSDCFRSPALARRVNVAGTAHVVRAVARVGARLVHLSTDMVFDGEGAPYDEAATTSPLSVYGVTKRDAELEVLADDDAVVVRPSLLFGPSRGARPSFFDDLLEALRSGRPRTLFDDEWRTPLSLAAAAEGIAAIALSDVSGLLHLGGPERMSRHSMGIRLARHLGLSDASIVRGSRNRASSPEPRPRDLALDSSRFRRLFPSPRRGDFEEECARMLG